MTCGACSLRLPGRMLDLIYDYAIQHLHEHGPGIRALLERIVAHKLAISFSHRPPNSPIPTL
jgi:hypothetical protein